MDIITGSRTISSSSFPDAADMKTVEGQFEDVARDIAMLTL
jgi:hypothetical protein